jgi:coproporphyrinogen III oxidase-like Fe-S oxidoreductase
MERAVAGDAVASTETVSRKDLPFEYMLNALRLREGFSLRDFGERTGLPLSSINAALNTAQDKGWLMADGARVVPTERGFDFLSDVQSLFLPG